MTGPAPSFRKQGDLPLIISVKNFIFFIIKKDGVQAQNKGHKKTKIIELEFLREEHFRSEKSFQKASEILSYRRENHFLRFLIDRAFKRVFHM